MGVKIYASNLAKKTKPTTLVYSNEWRISETNLVSADSIICGIKTEALKTK
jgi:hypothetical protein